MGWRINARQHVHETSKWMIIPVQGHRTITSQLGEVNIGLVESFYH